MLFVAVMVSGCAKTKAAANTEAPPLVVPAPPPRVLAPVEEPIAATPPPETAPAPPPRAPARTPPRRSGTSGQPAPEPDRTEPPAAAAPTPSTPAAEPPKEVVPVPAPADPAQERKVRDVLVRASRDLNRVDYRKLSTDGRSQYEQSKRFTEQAEQALKDHNYVFAATLADKAAALATELRGQ